MRVCVWGVCEGVRVGGVCVWGGVCGMCGCVCVCGGVCVWGCVCGGEVAY